jgi:hypothetical protein
LTYNGGVHDAFVAKVNAQGSALVYCGYIGGASGDGCNAIALDGFGNAYLAGRTGSDEASFPVKIGPDLTHNGNGDVFVAKLNGQGTGLDFCGYIGGASSDDCTKIAVDQSGNIYVAGETESSQSSFPVKVGPDLTYNGKIDAYLARVNSAATHLDFCGYIGGSELDTCGQRNGWGAVAVDQAGNVYFAGYTESSQSSFPVIVGPDLTHNGGADTFVAKAPPYHVLLRAGNVNTGLDNPVDVLFVNGSAGDDCFRTIVNPAGTPVTVKMERPIFGPNPAAFALYAWPGEAGADDVVEQPFDLGTACFPMPLGSGSPFPPPITLVNNIGYPFMLGNPMLPGVPPAPAYVVQNKILSPGTWTLQGVIFDNNSASGKASLTNAIVLVQQ